MDIRQNKAFSDYLYERVNDHLKHLRETNSAYQEYLREIEMLSRELGDTKHCAEQIRIFLERYNELKDLVGDMENMYLFAKGFAEYKRIEEYVAGEDIITNIFCLK